VKKYFFVATATISLLLPLAAYGRLHFLRPPRTASEQGLFSGIQYKKDILATPRPLVIHIVTIDLKTPGIKLFITPKTPPKARTTSEFLQEYKLQLAINASYFTPFHELTPWDYYPHKGDIAKPFGEVISNGDRYTKPEANWPVLCISPKNIATILDDITCPPGTLHGIAGREMLVTRGRPIAETAASRFDKPYSRVAIGVDQRGETLWLIVVDGKQPLYSEGVTLVELAQIFAKLGADRAINMDGGGSTTLVMATNNGAKVLNAPMQSKLPMQERPVANQIGFYALP
jgi:exopolysaccharide biosynthesis protein